MTDTNDPTGSDRPGGNGPIEPDEPTRVQDSTGAPGSEPTTTAGAASATSRTTRVTKTTDTPGGSPPPVWTRKPVIIGAVVALLAVILIAVFVLQGDDPEDTTATGTSDRDTSTGSSTTAPETSGTDSVPSSGDGATTTAPPATPVPSSEPGSTVPAPPNSAPDIDICQAYVAIEDGLSLVFDSGDLSDADVVARADQLADGLDRSVALLRGLTDEPYGADATTYADFLSSMAPEFRDATTREQVDAAGEKLFEPSVDVSEADVRLQDEYDAAGCL